MTNNADALRLTSEDVDSPSNSISNLKAINQNFSSEVTMVTKNNLKCTDHATESNEMMNLMHLKPMKSIDCETIKTTASAGKSTACSANCTNSSCCENNTDSIEGVSEMSPVKVRKHSEADFLNSSIDNAKKDKLAMLAKLRAANDLLEDERQSYYRQISNLKFCLTILHGQGLDHKKELKAEREALVEKRAALRAELSQERAQSAAIVFGTPSSGSSN